MLFPVRQHISNENIETMFRTNWNSPIRWKLLDIGLWKPLRFNFSKSFCQAQQCLIVLRFVDVVCSELGVEIWV